MKRAMLALLAGLIILTAAAIFSLAIETLFGYLGVRG